MHKPELISFKVFGPDSRFLPLGTAVWGMENPVWGSAHKRICFDQLHLGVSNFRVNCLVITQL